MKEILSHETSAVSHRSNSAFLHYENVSIDPLLTVQKILRFKQRPQRF